MKKTLTLLSLAFASASFASHAAVGDILSEDFESAQIGGDVNYVEFAADGDWQIVNRDQNCALPHRWCVSRSTDSNGNTTAKYAFIDGKSSVSEDYEPYAGTDWLLTPVLDLDGQYELSFQWKSSSQALDKEQYDFQVFVVEENTDITTVDPQSFVFSILDPEMVRESGIQPTDYDWYSVPWVGWTNYVSKIDLTPWQGKRVRVAFAYVITGKTGSYTGKIDAVNSIDLDDVRVYPHASATTPEATLSANSWNFGNVYVGAKVYSDVLTLTNTGTAGLKVSSVETPEGFSVVFDRAVEEIDLKKNEAINMQIVYEASLTSAASGNIVIKTNGTDATIAVSATKQMLAEDEVFEGFEGDAFPPAGWTAKKWTRLSGALEGSFAAGPNAYYQEENYLRSPRIDASKSDAKITFSYADFYNGESEVGADTEVKLQFSTNGGATWTTVDTFDYQDPYNTIVNKTYTQSGNGSDNCYWQFVWELTYYDSEYGAEASLFYLDAVVLNNIYGAGGAPALSSAVSPANGATGLFNRGLKLEWEAAQFATGYRLYVGTDAAATNVVNGEDVGNVLSYDLPNLAYSTTYNWKVVPYNSKGDATGVETWTFSTIDDPTISTLPYYEGFDEVVPPTGWNMIASGSTRWSINETSPYGGKASAMANPRENGNTAILETPDIVLSEAAFVSFYWGDGVAISLQKDETGQVTNNTKGDDGISVLTFEILVDGQWQQLAMLSDKTNPYWIRERFDLAPYVGKTIALRWVYTYSDYMKANGACIDEFAIESAAPVKLSFNADGYDAGKVNHDESFTTESTYAIYNDGSEDAEIKSVTFNSDVFGVSLKAGDVIGAGKAVTFSFNVSGNDANATVEDVMTLTTTSGVTVTFPVKAEVLPSDVRHYGFERDEYGTLNPSELTTIDVDRRSTVSLVMVDYAHRGEPMAFVVMNYKKADWSICYPNTGDQCLVTFGADVDGESVEDWIVSPAMMATEQSEFEFWCRDYLKSDDNRFGQAVATVLVSTESPTDRTTFEQVGSQQVPQPTGEEYYKFTVNLSKYAGKKIWVALRHTVTDGLAYFYDDFTFSHFNSFESGVPSVVSNRTEIGIYPAVATDVVNVSGVDTADLSVTSMTGAVVASAQGATSIDVANLAPGVYVLTARTADGVVSKRFIKR